MKYAKILITLILVFAISSAVSAKKKEEPKKVYAYGISASFTDSVVYYTPIQLVDSVHLDKHGFLPSRELYSYQLKNYFEFEMNQPNRVCMIYFSEKKAKLEKSLSKLLSKYKKNKSIIVEQIPASSFQFKKAE